MSLEWTARQLSVIRLSVDLPRSNPKPPGVYRPGSAAEAVMSILEGSPGRCFFRRQLIVLTGRTRKSIDWALLYIVATRRVETVPDVEVGAPHSGVLRYRVRRTE